MDTSTIARDQDANKPPQGALDENPTPEVIDGEAVDLEPGTALAVVERGPSAALFRTEDPDEIVQLATSRATALKAVLQAQGMTTDLGGRQPHVNIEGWQTLGSMSRVFAVNPRVRVLPWPEPTPDNLTGPRAKGLVYGYEAAYDAVHDGAVVGGGEATCNRSEKGRLWVDDHALKGMAQTRAQSRALRGPLGFIVAMAGYSATPTDEMPRDDEPAAPTPEPIIGEAEAPDVMTQIRELLGADAQRDRQLLVNLWKYIRGDQQYPTVKVAKVIGALHASVAMLAERGESGESGPDRSGGQA